MKQVRVLSLFSGCGMIFEALKQVELEFEGYSSDIEYSGYKYGRRKLEAKHAIAVEKHNFSHIKQLGNVCDIQKKDIPGEIDLLVGGFPCQAFSLAGKRAGLEDPRGGLYKEAVRLIHEIKPKIVILENVKGLLSAKCSTEITDLFGLTKEVLTNAVDEINKDLWGIEPVLINGALVSAQARERIWWLMKKVSDNPLKYVKVPIPQPKDKGILLRDIIETNNIDEKYYPKKAFSERTKTSQEKIKQNMGSKDGKSKTLGTNLASLSTTNGLVIECGNRLRRGTEIECERLMGLPDNYTQYGINEKGEKYEISTSQRYKMLGNGFQPPVLVHLINQII